MKDLSKEELLAAMEQLKKSKGWEIISQILSNNIVDLEKTILDADDEWSSAKLTKFRDMRFFEKKLLELPDKIIENASKEEDLPRSQIMEKLDPYEKIDNG